ncbi:MAG TPA: DUF3360 domain-containing protein [Pseudomonas sp.]|uniref:DUF3360 family protein n=1 Tax=Stutzerimonas frequens TaxID=2968969 RepID=UPI00093C4B60|nr:DUF3360 family protein [Stutzerimonas frequens]HAW61030.1 DUF3360 domain-containing protein [Pseudomonas sp.]MBK3873362.1 DUF3360 family protein [Stutzerimonas frequens]MBK3911631.1 DUF3360 family protein [Stutzerimonas frequens]MBK3930914.1 DUF3360 family protein [Stutzerimonas frequens]WOC80353.1 DUF3360 family protein [Stutzerimonas frequens]
MNDRNLRSYQELHKPKGNFATRAEYLEHELEIMAPKRWGINLPFRDYRFEYEDWVPAMAATIGKIVMVAAVVAAFAGPMGLSSEFVIENARYEMLIAALLFVVLFSGFLNPTANLAGTHGPLIPLIPLIVASGGHPMALGIMVGVLGFTLGVFKGGSLLARLTSDGVCGGLLLYLGFIGITSQIKKLFGWADGFDMGYIAFVVVFATIVMYAYLEHIRMRWLAIPLGSALAAVIALALGAPFEFTTEPGVPNLNPMYWWGETTGWQIGLPDLHHFIAVAPFAVLAVAMWSPDFLGHRVFQQLNYPPKAKKVLMNIDDTMCVAAARQIVGTSLGGGNLASSWGTFMVPAAIAKRPIPAGALLTGLLCVIAALWGYPMDLAIWPPVLSVALMVGVFLPLLEAGMQMTREGKTSQSAAIVIFSSALVNPVFGWSLTVLLDNLGLIGDKERGQSLSHLHRWVIPSIVFIVLCAVMLGIGMFPGIPAMFESFRIDL